MNDFPATRDRVGPVQMRQIHDDMEWLKDLQRASRITGVRNGRAVRTGLGTLLDIQRAPFGNGGFELYRVHAIGKDTLTCRSYACDEDGNEDIGTTDVTIARPLDMQPTFFDGQTHNGFLLTAIENGGLWDYRKWKVTTARAANAAAGGVEYIQDVETIEHIWPEYAVDKTVILAARHNSAIRAGTELIDVTPGRRWQTTARPIDVCITTNPQTGAKTFKRVMIPASQPFD